MEARSAAVGGDLELYSHLVPVKTFGVWVVMLHPGARWQTGSVEQVCDAGLVQTVAYSLPGAGKAPHWHQAHRHV